MNDFKQVNVSGERPLRGLSYISKFCNKKSKKSLDPSRYLLETLYWSLGKCSLDSSTFKELVG